MRRKHSKVLSKRIKLIMFSLIGIILLVYIIGILILDSYRQQVRSISDETLGFYGADINQEMEYLSRQLINTILNNESISEINRESSGSESEKTIDSIINQNRLLSYFESLSLDYRHNYHFWYANSAKDIFITYGNDYAAKEIYKGYMKMCFSDDTRQVVTGGKWLLMEIDGRLYLTTVYHLRDDYVGCWISPSDLMDSLWELENEIDNTIILTDNINNQRYSITYSEKWNGFSKLNGESKKSNDICRYDFSAASVTVEIELNYALRQKALYFEILMLCSAAVIAGICAGLFLYTRRMISRPIERFSKSLQSFKKTGEFDPEESYEEFEQAGAILKNLESEIKELKVRVYEEQIEKQKTQIDYMQLQIRPHFFINCLNSIFSMAQLERTEDIQKLVLYVTAYIRSTFRKGMNSVTLQEELDNIDNYLQLHRILYRYDCNYSCEADAELLPQKIPPLLVMIFVENSIKHSMGFLETMNIRITAAYEDASKARMRIMISDSGEGFSEESIARLNGREDVNGDDRFGIGIRNAKNRLALMYGDKASLLVRNGESGGAEVEIILPVTKREEKC